MLQALRKNNFNGFTLIELMVVIAIIGLLAAIAIPNYIAYRNSSFCSKAESDVNHMASETSDYYAIPTRTACVSENDLHTDEISPNTAAVACENNDPNISISVTITDTSGRCPQDYQAAVNSALNPTGYWDGSNHFIKIVQ